MASFERDLDIRGLRKQTDRDRKEGPTRSIWTRGRTLQNLHGQQLAILSPDYSYDLRDPVTGNFFFVVGYSKVGGPDIVPSG